jgi:hypothetical protein
VNDTDERAALADFVDSVRLWRQDPTRWMSELVDSATNCLVAGLDSPSLCVLAGTSKVETQFIVEPLVADTLDELGEAAILDTPPERGALEAMIRRFLDGRLTTRELSSWAHSAIGHDGPDDCQPFVLLDDIYDWESAGSDPDELARQARLEAEAFLAGRPNRTTRTISSPARPPADASEPGDSRRTDRSRGDRTPTGQPHAG